MPNTWVVVPEIRNCDMCHQDPPVPAYADGKTTFGPWANMCKPCFEIHGVGLGLGMGQELLLEPPGTTKELVTMDYRKALPHVGHHIVIVVYGNENIAVECEDCCEVVVDTDLPEELNPLVDGVPQDVTGGLWEGLPVILEEEDK